MDTDVDTLRRHHYTHHEEITPSPPATYPFSPPPYIATLACLFSPPHPSFIFSPSFAIFCFIFFIVRSGLCIMSNDQNKPMTQKLYESAPSSRQVTKFLTATTLGATLLFLSGLTLTGTVIALIMATPLMVVFSPILVPAGIVIFLVITGFLFSGGCGVAAITALSWIYNYVQGKHPPGANQLDYARNKLASKARGMTEKAKEYGQYVQPRLRRLLKAKDLELMR